MTREQIKDIQKKIGTPVDGFWGPKSIEACKLYLTRMMPKPHPWPYPDFASMQKFYGVYGESHLTNLPIPPEFNMRFEGKLISSVRCHEKVADSLYKALLDVARGPDFWVLQEYAGCFYNRPMRTSASISKHAWGAAIDLAPASNGLYDYWPDKANMPLTVMEAFARQGWKNLGWLIGRDAMHFEATR